MSKGRLLAGVLLSIVLLYVFLHNIDLATVWAIIKSGDSFWLTIALVFNVLNFFLRAVRWRYFLLPIKKTRLWNLYSATIIGFAVSAIFPARIGEVVRPYLLGMKENISRTAAIATIVIERLFDTTTVLFMLVVYLLVLIRPEQLSEAARNSLVELKSTGLVLFLLVVIGLMFLYYLKKSPAFIRKLVRGIERFLPKKAAASLDHVVDSFVEGLSILHDPGILFKISYWSIIFWLVICVGFWACAKAFHPAFPFTGTFLIMILLAVGIAVPTPGGVGSYHILCKFGLMRFFNVPDAQASAIALVSHAINFIPVIFQGLIFFWHEGLTTRKISNIAEKSEEGSEAAGAEAP